MELYLHSSTRLQGTLPPPSCHGDSVLTQGLTNAAVNFITGAHVQYRAVVYSYK